MLSVSLLLFLNTRYKINKEKLGLQIENRILIIFDNLKHIILVYIHT